MLQIHTRYREPGGEDVVVEAEAALLRAGGHEVVAYHAENSSRPVTAASMLARAAWNPGAARAMTRLVQRTQPDVAHVHNTWFALSPSIFSALRQAGVPVIMTLHNYRLVCANAQLYRDGRPCDTCVPSHPWHGVRHQCYRGSGLLTLPASGAIALHRWLGTWQQDVDLFLTPSEFTRALFVRAGLPADRIRVKPNFVPDPGPRHRPAGSSRTVLFVGRLAAQKGIDVLLAAWKRFGGDGLELAVLGDGPLQGELDRHPPAGVRFEGRVDGKAVRDRMLAARALVFPSRSFEVQPLVVLEALAAGLPVLASDLGGTPELLEPLGRDWLVTPGDPRSWATALWRLGDASHVELASRLARARYEQLLTPARAVAALESAYDQASSTAVALGRTHT